MDAKIFYNYKNVINKINKNHGYRVFYQSF